MNPYLQVALGGSAGAVARYAIARGIVWPGFPVATLLVNVAGSFLMGLLSVLLAQRLGTLYAPLLLTGFLGGFTTFSAFSLDALTLWERGQVWGMGLYILVSVVMSLLAVIAGLAVGRGLWA